MSWSRDAQPTGPEDESAILNAIGTAVDSVWSSIRMATRRSNEEDEETWKKRRNEAYRQLAPLLDRVSRLNGDASALLTFMGEGNHIPPGPPIHQPSLSLPPIPSISREEEDPCEGMSNRIRSGFNDGDVVIVLNRNEPQTVVVPIKIKLFNHFNNSSHVLMNLKLIQLLYQMLSLNQFKLNKLLI